MSHRKTALPRSKTGYFELNEQHGSDPRSSTSSHSPMLVHHEQGDLDKDSFVEPTTFDTSGLETFYRPVDGYEGAHRYDPAFTWDPRDERNVVRKVCTVFLRRHLEL